MAIIDVRKYSKPATRSDALDRARANVSVYPLAYTAVYMLGRFELICLYFHYYLD